MTKKAYALALRCCLAALVLAPAAAFSAEKSKILFVASNVVDMGDPEQHDARNNLWEYAPPFHIFVMHGYEVDFVSPQGGPVEFMMDPLGISSYAIKYENFLGKVANTLKPSQIDIAQYQAVYVGGGYGILFDVASNEELMKLIGGIYENGGVVGGCGHGPGGFANATLRNGSYLVKGKRVAGFPNSTERSKSWAKQGSLLPFLVEDQLRKNGAHAQNKDTLADKHTVVVDQRIVSTMFLPSAALVAEEMVRLLSRHDP
ncbi:type 1 glutamine amidotransferase domain-containing protein [Parahaliea mediterranea]|uniref:Type 1 glutamine amidotransferase domain-containing protein n=1 Tax=Parahaliea mediterranea TaxID=651086 RepID=A0A939DIG9_9GAMM|nr:type 1 glutamine amidotransferase domain-containing protein [Parahaliea mediterranea]MBN7798771.1 type 1 glutamine amidotransferase domain-containing protein [Parahaliea mediterranea]